MSNRYVLINGTYHISEKEGEGIGVEAIISVGYVIYRIYQGGGVEVLTDVG